VGLGALRLGGRFLFGVLVLVVLGGGLFELLNGLAEALGELGELFGAKEENHDGEDEKEFRAAQTEDAGDK